MEEQQAGILALPAPQEQDGQPLSINLRTYDEAEGRFYCPFPGCTRSFAELWRLKVHYRAPPDIRGSGKERGHGTELMHCPKCGNTLKPGKHHVGCIAGKGAPRLVYKRKGSGHAENGDGMAPPKKSKKKGAAPQPKPEPQEQEQESSRNIPMSLLPMPDMSIPSLTPPNGWGGLDMHAPQDSSMLPLGLSIPPPQFWPEFPVSNAQQQPASYSNGAQMPLPGYPWQSAPQLPGSLMMPFLLPPPPLPSQGEHSTPDAVDPSWAAWAQQQQQQQLQQFLPQPDHDGFAQPHHHQQQQQQQQQQHLSYQQQQDPFSMHFPSQHQHSQQHSQQQQQHLQHSQPSQTTAFMPPSDTSQAAAQLMLPCLPNPAETPNPELGPFSRQVTPIGVSNPVAGGCTLQSAPSLPSLGSLNLDILPDPLAAMSDPSHNLQSMPHHHPHHDGGSGRAQQPGPLMRTPSTAESAPSPPGGAAAQGEMLSGAGGAMGSQAADADAAEAAQAQAMLQEVDGDLLCVPSPPPLPNDFHPGNARPIFNFGQFNQRMPASQTNFGSISNQELGDIEAMDLAELNVVYNHSNDGELMQLLFGIGGDVPSMATVHMHKGPSPPPLPQIPDEDEPSLLLNRPSPIQGMNGSQLINLRPRSASPQPMQQQQQQQQQFVQPPPRMPTPLSMSRNHSSSHLQQQFSSKPLENPPQASQSFAYQNELPHIPQLSQPPRPQQQANHPSRPQSQIKQEAPQGQQQQESQVQQHQTQPLQQQHPLLQQQSQMSSGAGPMVSGRGHVQQSQPQPSQHHQQQLLLQQQSQMSSGTGPMVCGQAELVRHHPHHHLLGSSRTSSALNLAAFADRSTPPSDSLTPLMPPPSCGCGGGCELGA